MSAPVNTATTPGSDLARSVSIERMVACGRSDRTMKACSWFGRLMSSVYRPRPFRKRRSSLRRTEAPMPWNPISAHSPTLLRFGDALLGRLHRLAVHERPRRGDRLDDVMIPSAAAEIALEPFADLVFVQSLGMHLNQVDRAHHHAGCTEPALQGVMLAE